MTIPKNIVIGPGVFHVGHVNFQTSGARHGTQVIRAVRRILAHTGSYRVAVVQQILTEMRTEKPGSARHGHNLGYRRGSCCGCGCDCCRHHEDDQYAKQKKARVRRQGRIEEGVNVS